MSDKSEIESSIRLLRKEIRDFNAELVVITLRQKQLELYIANAKIAIKWRKETLSNENHQSIT